MRTFITNRWCAKKPKKWLYATESGTQIRSSRVQKLDSAIFKEDGD